MSEDPEGVVQVGDQTQGAGMSHPGLTERRVEVLLAQAFLLVLSAL